MNDRKVDYPVLNKEWFIYAYKGFWNYYDEETDEFVKEEEHQFYVEIDTPPHIWNEWEYGEDEPPQAEYTDVIVEAYTELCIEEEGLYHEGNEDWWRLEVA